ncbi:hypothetical protein F5Y08DRAFT_349696 [Xylaria arbuscula]|nr:hypothetical protein F5Y08DRAFT_349696 [Xylaria arbuscula]
MHLARVLRTSTHLPAQRAFVSPSPRFHATMAASLTPPVPIVLIGLHTEIGAPVAEGLRPDYDIVRFIQTFEAAKTDLPYLLQGSAPPDPPINSVGSEDYSRGPVRAVLFGRGFSQQQAETLYGLYNNEAKADRVLWVAGAEAHRKSGKVGAEPPPNPEKIIVPIFRSLLEDWKKKVESGDEAGTEEGKGVVLY